MDKQKTGAPAAVFVGPGGGENSLGGEDMAEYSSRNGFHVELKMLESDLVRLGERAQDALTNATWALKERDFSLAREVIQDEEATNLLAERIDSQGFQLIARNRPIGQDLRTVSAILHMAVDLERIGDYGVHIAKIALAIGDAPFVKPLVDIPRMATRVREMIGGALCAFLGRDAAAAREICPLDDEVDDLEKRIMRDLIDLMTRDSRTIPQSTRLLLVARNLERAGDHATNLAERILFMITGVAEKSCSLRRPLCEVSEESC
jgi:phosphate transport system protein